MNQDWKNDPKLKNIDQEKLNLLQLMAEQGIGKNPSELLPYILSVSTQNKKNGMKFTADEISVIIEVLKSDKSPEEARKLDRIVTLMKMIR